MTTDLEPNDKTAHATGSTAGIGLEIARTLAVEGENVILSSPMLAIHCRCSTAFYWHGFAWTGRLQMLKILVRISHSKPVGSLVACALGSKLGIEVGHQAAEKRPRERIARADCVHAINVLEGRHLAGSMALIKRNRPQPIG